MLFPVIPGIVREIYVAPAEEILVSWLIFPNY